jgi:DNA-binding protein H-NS
MTTIQTATQAPAPKDKAVPPSLTNGHEAAESGSPPLLPFDPSKFSDAVVAEVIVQCQRTLDERKAKREADFFASIRDNAQALGITPARLAAALANKTATRSRSNGGTDGRSVVRPKYRSKDHSSTWSGRGAEPAWFKQHLAAGGKPEELLISEGAV